MRGGVRGQREGELDWGRGLWGEANGRESGLRTRGQWRGELGGGVAAGVKPMAWSAALARPMAGRVQEREGGGGARPGRRWGRGAKLTTCQVHSRTN